jgi:hypothetical protein
MEKKDEMKGGDGRSREEGNMRWRGGGRGCKYLREVCHIIEIFKFSQPAPQR